MTKTLTLRSIDIPQLHRYGVGFDRMFDRMDESLRINSQNNSYPPFNMIKYDEDTYSIELAVAGFREGEITLQVQDNQLTIEGEIKFEVDDAREYVHRGISGRSFVRVFTLAEHVEVLSASQENGILTVDLKRRVPEEKKPKQVAINYLK